MSKRIPVWILAGLAISTLALSATPASAARPVAVSPGSTKEVTMIDQRCPSFSWGAVEGARGYELAVFRLREGVEASLQSTEPVLRQRLPGGALSWTPSMARCLSPGGRYAWLVRSFGEEGVSEWSEPRLFETAAGPSPADVEQALAVLRAYLAAGGVELEKGWVTPAPAVKPETGERREASRAPSGARLESPGGPEGVAVPEVTAVKAQVPDPLGVTFGLYGISASTDDNSAGVVGESTATGGATFGVLGEVDSAAGVAGAFDNTAGGKILSGRNNAVEVFSVDGVGDVTVSGLVDGVDVSAHTADTDAHHTSPTSLPPSGPAGGDLAGTFPNPDVVDDSHTHTGATVPDLWVNVTGDTMTGTLTLTPGAGNALEANADINLASGNVLKNGTLFIHDDGTGNTAVGRLALSSNTTGSRNTASGYEALRYNTSGFRNTASGVRALRSNTTGFENTASGYLALFSNTTGYRNTASGFQALNNNTTGRNNTAVGRTALRQNTTGDRNTAVGMNALYPNTTGYDNAALGMDALRLNTTGYRNTAVGMGALHDNTTGSTNTATGYAALRSNTTGYRNTATGFDALRSNTTGYRNTASGYRALYANTTGTRNTASGYLALRDNTTGSGNTATGNLALRSNTTASANTASGTFALSSNTTGFQNTATGTSALNSNTTGSFNTATGASALSFNTTGYRNTASGVHALYFNTTGFQNTASGQSALRNNSTGYRNTASGFEALNNNTTGRNNTAVGRTALRQNTTGDRNTGVGMNALYPNTTGYDNAALGMGALRLNTTGYRNTAVGMGALHDNTTGGDNIALGFGAGYDIETGSNNIDIGNRGGSAAESGTIRIGTQGTQTATYIAGIRGITTGVSDAVTVLIDSAGQLGTVSSSRRFKKEIVDMGEASDQLLELRPVTFKYKQEPVEGSQPLQFGLIAEEVAEVLPGLVVYDEEGHPSTVRYHLLSSMLLNELQKQQRQLADQRQLIERLMGRLARLEAVEAKRPVAAGSLHPPPANRTRAP